MTLFRATEAFAFTDANGTARVITHGTLMSDDDPDLKGREHLFGLVEVANERPAEQAADESLEDVSAQRHRAQDDAAKASESAPHFPDQEWIDSLPKVEDG